MFAALAVFARILVVDEHAAHADVAEAEQHMGFGGFAVAAGAADLLVIGFEAGRQIGVEDEAHIGFVDAHAEGDGRDHDHIGLGHEGVLVGLARLLGHAGVIGQRADAFGGEQAGGFFGLLARQAIDDAALPGPGLDEGEKLLLPALPWA